MSLVQCVLTPKFIIAASETRATKPDGNVIDNFNKLIKLNDQIIFGCTGNTIDNYNLFYGFCDYSDESGLVKLDKEINISYNDFVTLIMKNFKKMEKIHNDVSNNIKYEIMSIVCGYNGNEFEATLFSLTSIPGENSGIVIGKCSNNMPYRCINAGKYIHLNEFEKTAKMYYHKMNYDFTTIRQFKNILTNVFKNGVTIDKSINDNIIFERIRLKDVIT